jgi:hypothetical protein
MADATFRYGQREFSVPNTWEYGIRRNRHRSFAYHFVKGMLERNETRDEAILHAAKIAWQRLSKQTSVRKPFSDDFLLRKGLDTLESEEVRGFIQMAFAAAGFEFGDGIKQHIKHIKGEITKETLSKDGSVVELKEPANYQALKDYEALVLPQKTVKIDQRIVTANITSAAPKIRARRIVTVKELPSGDES